MSSRAENVSVKVVEKPTCQKTIPVRRRVYTMPMQCSNCMDQCLHINGFVCTGIHINAENLTWAKEKRFVDECRY